MGKLISVVIVLVVLATAAVTLISFLRTPADNNTTVTRQAQQDQQQAAPGNTMDKAVSTYQEDVRPTFLRAGDVLFSWIGDFYSSNKMRFVDLTWTIIATVMAGLILQRMRTA